MNFQFTNWEDVPMLLLPGKTKVITYGVGTDVPLTPGVRKWFDFVE